jgi:carboxylesterase type B
MCVGTLLAVPRADGLFRRAIAQRGAAHRVTSAEVALRIGRYLADRLGVPATREAMAAIPPERLVIATAQLREAILAAPDPARWGAEVIASLLPLQPVIDGDVLPGRPIERIAAGTASGVDVLAGSNADDWRLFVIANGSMERVTDEVLAGPVVDHGFECAAAFGVTREALATYRAANPAAAPGEILAAIQTDWWCRIPAIRLAEAHVGSGGKTYMYEFAWPSPAFGGGFGACHALEIPFVFDTLDLGPAQMQGPLLGDDPPQALADAMHGAWVAFAATGDPGWPRYDLERRATMRFDATSRVVDDPRAFERALWEGIA